MPLLKAAASKSQPNKAIDYITREDKAKIVSSMNLDDHCGYAKQFKETSDIFNKNKKFDDRKYYHFKLSANPIDNVSYETHHRFAEEFVKRAFPNFESVIATHTDTDVIHSHIVTNSINMENGKKMRISKSEYKDLKELANSIGLEFGLTPLDFQIKSKIKLTQEELHIELKGGTSWKEELREVIDLAKSQTSSMEEFSDYLKNYYNVEIVRNSGNTITFKHPLNTKKVRGKTLGQNYERRAILDELTKNGHQYNGVRISSSADKEQRNNLREQNAPRSAERRSDSTNEIDERISGKRKEIHDRVFNNSESTDFEFEQDDTEIHFERNESIGFDQSFS